MKKQDYLVGSLLFMGAFLGVMAAAGADILPPILKLLAAGGAAGCGAVLAVLRPVGASIRPPQATEREQRVAAVREAGRANG
jgi:hypothetical protein